MYRLKQITQKSTVMGMGDQWGDDDDSMRWWRVEVLAFRMHQCGHRPYAIIHLQWHLVQSWCSEKGKHDREHLHSSRELTSLPLSALPIPLLFVPDVYRVDSVCSSSVQFGNSYSQTCCYVSIGPFFLDQGFLLLGFVPSPHRLNVCIISDCLAFLSLRTHCLLMEILIIVATTVSSSLSE